MRIHDGRAWVLHSTYGGQKTVARVGSCHPPLSGFKGWNLGVFKERLTHWSLNSSQVTIGLVFCFWGFCILSFLIYSHVFSGMDMMFWKFLLPKMIKTYDNVFSTILMVLFTHMNESWVWLSWFQYSVLVWLSNDPQKSCVKDLVPTLVLLKDDRNVRGGALSAGLCLKGIVDSGFVFFFLHPGLNVPWCHHEIQPHRPKSNRTKTKWTKTTKTNHLSLYVD